MKNIIITIPVTDEEKAIFEEMIGDCRERFRIVYMDELSYYTKEVGTASAIICADNLYRYTHGQNLLHVVDRKKGY